MHAAIRIVLADLGPEIAQVGPQHLDRNGVAPPEGFEALGRGTDFDDLAQGLVVVDRVIVEAKAEGGTVFCDPQATFPVAKA